MNSRTHVLIHQGFDELSELLANDDTVELRDTSGLSDEEIAHLLLSTDVLVSGEFKPAWYSDRSSRLRVVQSTGAGTDAIDRASLPSGCKVCNVYGHDRGVAEHVFMLMLALQGRLLRLDAALRKGDWSPQWPLTDELRQRRILLLGLGHIGLEIARIAGVFDLKVTALTRSPSPGRSAGLSLEYSGALGELKTHLSHADFIVIAIPHTPETEDLIGPGEFALMKPTAYLINVGRAPVVNEEALYNALSTRQIAGAGLNVWYQYPDTEGEIKLPSSFPIHELDNVIMTPHKPTVETMEYRWSEIAENIRRVARGESPKSVVSVIP